MLFDPDFNGLPHWPASQALIFTTYNDGGIEAQMQADPKKLGKAKKPDANLVSRVSPAE